MGGGDEALSKLNEYIYGVKFVELGEVCEILDSKRRPISKKNRQSGKYPYYGANGIQDYVNDYIFDGEFVLVGEDGSVLNKNGSPVVNLAKGKIWVNNHAHILAQKEFGARLKFIYYYLQTIKINHLVKGSIPKLTQKDLKEIKIPLPPLEIQEKIVEILDNFDKICNDLKEGLPREIELRNKQYEYYRDKLLAF